MMCEYLLTIICTVPVSITSSMVVCFFFFQAEDGIRDAQESRGLGDVYKRQVSTQSTGIKTALMLSHGTLLARPRFAFHRLSSTLKRIEELGYTLPAVGAPKGSYVPVTRVGNLLFTAGHLPTPAGADLITGKVGEDLSVEEGNKAAEYVALSLLATIQQEIGDLDKIKRIVKLVGFVNCTDGFAQQPQVINGASDLIGEVLGERGVHARSAVGTNALPLNIPVEIEAIVEVEE
eukprot:TRINITY_DN1552_c0_g1_i1.p1 TRINITY_DN1552_c0_g1~~TRINITY_DN1552_c0_g1_i1.p1  ORF type:complete len:234 (+),score=53.32 TRINITY_DN1552_c0_g1_i1:23-724(+)